MKKLALAASAIGIFAGIGGASHGPGEILQGNSTPNGVMIEAWPSLTVLGGEPAMTVLPNFFIAGVLTIVMGAIVAAWAGGFIERRNGGLFLIVLSLLLLLVGGGIIPPFFGVAGGIIAMISNYRRVERP